MLTPFSLPLFNLFVFSIWHNLLCLDSYNLARQSCYRVSRRLVKCPRKRDRFCQIVYTRLSILGSRSGCLNSSIEHTIGLEQSIETLHGRRFYCRSDVEDVEMGRRWLCSNPFSSSLSLSLLLSFSDSLCLPSRLLSLHISLSPLPPPRKQ